MTVTIKTPAEQDKMRAAGRLAASVLDMIEPFVQPGATTDELDKRCHDFIVDELKSIPANLNYRGFPKTICTSVNHVVCHGIPGDKRLKSGDIINIDVTVIRDGFHGDTSRMYFVGNGRGARPPPDGGVSRSDVARHPGCQAGRPFGRHRPCHPDLCRKQ